MNKTDSLVSIAPNGEFIYHGLNSHIGKKYRADNPLDKSFVPYLIMIFCAAVDGAVFYNLFKMLSYDSPFTLGVQVAGCLFAFDIVPVYLGIQLRRIKQGLSKDRFILWIALAVCILACALNVVLRLMTMDRISPDLSSSAADYFGNVIQENQSSGVDATAIALTVFGIVLPVLTSAGSFFISYLTYNPLKVRKRRLEEMLTEKEDEIRRLDAVLFEYEADSEFAEHLVQIDEGKFEEMKRMYRALVISYCDYVRERLKEHLANPAAVSVLSEESCTDILDRLDKDLDALYKAEVPKVYVSSKSKEKTPISNKNEAAA